MSFYRERIYPHLVSLLGNPKPIAQIRQRIVPLAQGDVLEVGVGPGVNFSLYDLARVQKVYALEPNSGCSVVPKNNGQERDFKSSFSICPENAFRCQTRVLIRL
jgi:16S rRNA A1518/A1519 N6-dimethyltransferase RsmA/KsgA/DIM1 with predicted DNA glycosylase/AP lyase activity